MVRVTAADKEKLAQLTLWLVETRRAAPTEQLRPRASLLSITESKN